MSKIIVKTIKKAYSVWKPNPLIRCYHYAAAFNNNKMIAFAKNNPIKFNAKAYRMGEMFNINTYKEYPYPHAESDLISNYFIGITPFVLIGQLLYFVLIEREEF